MTPVAFIAAQNQGETQMLTKIEANQVAIDWINHVLAERAKLPEAVNSTAWHANNEALRSAAAFLKTYGPSFAE